MLIYFWFVQASPTPSEESYPDPDPVHVEYSYSVKVINPNKKSEYSVRKWRVNERYTSVVNIKRQLKRAFESKLPDHENIQFGYLKPGHGAWGKQEWIVSLDDLEDMYSSYGERKEVLLWAYSCDAQRKKDLVRQLCPKVKLLHLPRSLILVLYVMLMHKR